MNLQKIKDHFPEYSDMKIGEFFKYMHKTYYPEMKITDMYKALLKLTQIIKEETATNGGKDEIATEDKSKEDKMDKMTGKEELAKPIEKEAKTTITAKDKGNLLKLGYNIKDISSLTPSNAENIIDGNIQKPEETIIKEKQANTIEEIKTLLVNSLNSKPETDKTVVDSMMHSKIDVLIKKIGELIAVSKEKPTPPKVEQSRKEKWEFKIERDKHGNIDNVIGMEI